MFVRPYFRASTQDQNAERAVNKVVGFLADRGVRPASLYIENISGTERDRPELTRLLRDSQPGDVIVVEQIDRLTRLSRADWDALKRQIVERGVRIASLDVPTSLISLEPDKSLSSDPVIAAVLDAVNNMLIDVMAAMSRKDYETRRERQAQGIERAKKEGRYTGRVRDEKRYNQVLELRFVRKMSLKQVAELTGYSVTHICRIQKEHKNEQN